MTDQKSSSITWALGITSVITMIGWGIISCTNSERDRKNKIRDIKTSYLIDAYKKLSYSSQRAPDIASYHRDVEAAIADIQLFGTKEQVDILLYSIDKAKVDSFVRLDMDTILNTLKNSLRKEIDLDPVPRNVQWFRFSETNPNP